MENRIIAIDQSTSATKAMLFTEKCELIKRVNKNHQQYYPKSGWVEHDAEEIFQNVLRSIRELIEKEPIDKKFTYSLSITNQRETVVVWDRKTSKPVYNAIVWQCLRGDQFCKELIAKGFSQMVREKSGLFLDPYFSASGAKWILDNIKGVRESAEKGELLMGTIDSWIIWKLTNGTEHVTDHTNASRTLLYNINTHDWDDDLLSLFTIPRSMMPRILPCDSIFGETTVNGLFNTPIEIAGVIGDSHGALVGQMCFEKGYGKVTYGTGSSVMLNIGSDFVMAPLGLVTSIGFSALGKICYVFEGNIHSTGATINWFQNQFGLFASFKELEDIVTSTDSSNGVYVVPAFSGLGAPWWRSDIKAAIFGLTLSTSKSDILRAAIESIAYQITDLIRAMSQQADFSLKEIRADGGATSNEFLMQFQADMLQVPINISEIEEASALGAAIMNGFARKTWNSFDDVDVLRKNNKIIKPYETPDKMELLYAGWSKSVQQLVK